MLEMAKVVLERIPDSDMNIFSEKGTRSCISYSSNRYSKDNNGYLKSYDLKIKEIRIERYYTLSCK